MRDGPTSHRRSPGSTSGCPGRWRVRNRLPVRAAVATSRGRHQGPDARVARRGPSRPLQRRGRPDGEPVEPSLHRHDLRCGRRRRRAPVPGHGVLPGTEPRPAGASRADRRGGGAQGRHQHRLGRRDRPSRGSAARRRQAGQRPDQSVRPTRTHRLRHLRCAVRDVARGRGVIRRVGAAGGLRPTDAVLTEASDIYGLGALLYHALAGQVAVRDPGRAELAVQT